MDQFLTIAGTVAATQIAIQILSAVLREWRSARRLVAVHGLDAETYAVYACVPLQFAGSRYLMVRIVVAAIGFFGVRPKTPKHAFAACEIAGTHEDHPIDYRDIRPRDHLRIRLDEGEHPAVLDRSMRRGVASFYRTIAIRELGSPGFDESVHCVTVRTGGDLVRASGDGDSLWLEYEVTSAAPRSGHRSGRHSLADLPEDAIELLVIPPPILQRASDTAAGQARGTLHQKLMRRNLSPRAGFAHVVARYLIPLVVLAGFSVRFLGWQTTGAILIACVTIPVVLLAMLAMLAIPAVVVAICLRARARVRARRPPNGQVRQRDSEPADRRIPLRGEKLHPPRIWTGATARSLSAGRDFNGVDARSMVRHAWWQSTGFLPRRGSSE